MLKKCNAIYQTICSKFKMYFLEWIANSKQLQCLFDNFHEATKNFSYLLSFISMNNKLDLLRIDAKK